MSRTRSCPICHLPLVGHDWTCTRQDSDPYYDDED